MTSHRPWGMAAALTATLAWGGMFVVAETALPHVDAVWQTAIRYGVASIVFLALLALVEGRGAFAPTRELRSVALLGSVGFAGFNLLAFLGLRWTTPQAASLIVSTMPLITAFVLWARTGDRPPVATWATSAVALLGVATVLGDGDVTTVLHGGLNRGDLLVLLGATCWVVYTTGAANLPDWSPLRYTALSATAGATVVVALALGLSLAGVLAVPTAGDLTAVAPQLAYVVVLAAVVAVLCWNQAMRTLGPQDGVLFINLVPLTTFTVEAFRGEAPHPGELLGVAITMGALLANNLLARRRGSAPVGRSDEAVRQPGAGAPGGRGDLRAGEEERTGEVRAA